MQPRSTVYAQNLWPVPGQRWWRYWEVCTAFLSGGKRSTWVGFYPIGSRNSKNTSTSDFCRYFISGLTKSHSCCTQLEIMQWQYSNILWQHSSIPFAHVAINMQSIYLQWSHSCPTIHGVVEGLQNVLNLICSSCPLRCFSFSKQHQILEPIYVLTRVPPTQHWTICKTLCGASSCCVRGCDGL